VGNQRHNCEAKLFGSEVFSTKRGIVWSGASVVGNTVNDVLIGGSDLNTNVANTASVTSTSNGSLGLLATLK
jgi:hypothetical protein